MKNRKRNRMKGYDYSRDNLYFVTICVKDRICCLGAGRIVGAGRSVGAGRDLSVHHPDNKNHFDRNESIQLNTYGLIVQERIVWLGQQYEYIEIHNYVVMPNHIHLIIEIDSLRVEGKAIKIKSLSSLMGALKTTSSKLIHETGLLPFAWQRSFHDHIIRSDRAYQNISNYIDLNPQKWSQDVLLVSFVS